MTRALSSTSSTQVTDSDASYLPTGTATDPVGHAQGLFRLGVERRQRTKLHVRQIHSTRTTCAVEFLFTPCSPLHVFRFVVSIVVDALQAVFGRGAMSNVREKVSPVLLPPFAHLYASTTIASVPGIPGVVASVACRPPCLVFWNHSHSGGV